MVNRIFATAVLAIVLCALPAPGMGSDLGTLLLDSQKSSKAKVKGVGPVLFTHGAHAKRTKCSTCHPKVFKKKKGASGINMQANMEGKFCGTTNCHNSTKTFPLYECNKCHQKKN